jgi:hypothetical protein
VEIESILVFRIVAPTPINLAILSFQKFHLRVHRIKTRFAGQELAGNFGADSGFIRLALVPGRGRAYMPNQLPTHRASARLHPQLLPDSLIYRSGR